MLQPEVQDQRVGAAAGREGGVLAVHGRRGPHDGGAAAQVHGSAPGGVQLHRRGRRRRHAACLPPPPPPPPREGPGLQPRGLLLLPFSG